MKRFLCFALTLVPALLWAGWSRMYGGAEVDQGKCIDYTYDDCFIIVGNTRSFGDDWCTWLLKVDSTGDTLWTRTYEGSGKCVAETSDKGFIIVGGSRLLKTDSCGDTVWARTYTGIGEFWGSFVQETSDGDYIITGSTQHPDSSNTDFLLLKVDSSGDSLWALVWGSEDYDWGNCIRESADGGYVVTGSYYAFEGLWGAEVFWAKYDKEGSLVWRDVEGKSMDYAYEGLSIQLTNDGGYIISGYVQGTGEGTATLLIKINDQGKIVWMKEFSTEYFGDCVQPTADGGYVLTGSTWSLCKSDDNGNILWERNYEGSGRYLIVTPNGDYVVTGTKDDDLWLLKTDSSGDTLSGIDEIPPVSITHLEVTNSIGREVTLRYSDCPSGFHAYVHDASGRRVDELKSPNQNGILIWGPHQNPGVYFIVPDGSKGNPLKVVLIR